MTERFLHPEGTFTGELISFGDIKRSDSGLYYFMMEFDTGERGPVFASVCASPNVLIIIHRAFAAYKLMPWVIKVKHRTFSGAIHISAEAWPASTEANPYA